jgi:hypothetical protein
MTWCHDDGRCTRHAADDAILAMRLSMHGVLMAWRVADRALIELAEGSPEWAAVNATLTGLRASYLGRFDEYVARSPKVRGASTGG